MKIMLFLYVSIFFLLINNYQIINCQEDLKKPLILISKCDEEDCRCLLRQLPNSNPDAGFTYYVDIDTNKYKKHEIFFVIEDLKKKFKLLESKIDNALGGPETFRNSFHFYFQYNDSTMLVVSGCINSCREFDIKDNEEARKTILGQRSYAMFFYLLDVKKYYIDTYNLGSFKDFNPFKDDRDVSMIRKYYWDLVKDLIKEK